MTLKTALALAVLLLPLMFGAAACDSNSSPVAGCLPAGGASTDAVSGLAVSSAADACAQGLADAVDRSTATAAAAAVGGGGQPSPQSTVAHRGR